MSGMGGGSSGGGGSGSSGGDGVAQELAEVRAKIEKLEKAIEVQQEKLEAAGFDVVQIATALVADKQRLVELQKKKNRLAEQQREQQQQHQQQQQQAQAAAPAFTRLRFKVRLTGESATAPFALRHDLFRETKHLAPRGTVGRSGAVVEGDLWVGLASGGHLLLASKAIYDRWTAESLWDDVEWTVSDCPGPAPVVVWQYQPHEDAMSPRVVYGRVGELKRRRDASDVDYPPAKKSDSSVSSSSTGYETAHLLPKRMCEKSGSRKGMLTQEAESKWFLSQLPEDLKECNWVDHPMNQWMLSFLFHRAGLDGISVPTRSAAFVILWRYEQGGGTVGSSVCVVPELISIKNAVADATTQAQLEGGAFEFWRNVRAARGREDARVLAWALAGLLEYTMVDMGGAVSVTAITEGLWQGFPQCPPKDALLQFDAPLS